jgi:Zn-dependent peptidase ImmA (M78 family)
LRARSLTQRELSQRLKLKPEQLERELQREPEPKQSILNDIAKELAIPSFVLLMQKIPPLHDVIPDFRSEHPAPSPKSRATIETIQLAEGVQRAAAQSRVSGASNLPSFSLQQPNEVDAVALKARRLFGISLQDQLEAKDARTFYVLCRKKIEDKGIFVLQESFPKEDGSGFCLSHPKHPVIVINTKQQTRARRLFTLVHELAHVLIGKSGISDPFIRRNSTERLCNRFAGSFLVPESYVKSLLSKVGSDPTLDDVAWAARRLKISQEATVVRLEQIGLYKSGSHAKWLKAIHNVGNPDFSDKGGGSSGPPPQEKVKLAKYGFRFASVFAPLVSEGQISEINLFRSSGLKPKYQRAYFDYARSITPGDLTTLGLEDE